MLDASCRYRSERHSTLPTQEPAKQKQPLGLKVCGRWWRGQSMTDKTFLIRFKLATHLSPRPVLAARAEIRGEHLVLLDSEEKLAALFLLEIVESWSELNWSA